MLEDWNSHNTHIITPPGISPYGEIRDGQRWRARIGSESNPRHCLTQRSQWWNQLTEVETALERLDEIWRYLWIAQIKLPWIAREKVLVNSTRKVIVNSTKNYVTVNSTEKNCKIICWSDPALGRAPSSLFWSSRYFLSTYIWFAEYWSTVAYYLPNHIGRHVL